ncbi:MAG: hypothetical protein LIO94_04890, partial [Clostridiales bacterium]|nr:hypothetical protein [Clostridiales bacterium]
AGMQSIPAGGSLCKKKIIEYYECRQQTVDESVVMIQCRHGSLERKGDYGKIKSIFYRSSCEGW